MMNLKYTFLLLLILLLGFPANLFAQQALIPLPQELSWKKGTLNLDKGIYIPNYLFFKNEMGLVKQFFEQNNIKDFEEGRRKPLFTLQLLTKTGLGNEGYNLEINAKGITIGAEHETGLFYALKTLEQLLLENKKLPYVKIRDIPAFSFRGFLLDVGRNYQPVAMLKEQIDVMAKYKLNVLHFHFTEDIAWRLESKKYPGLTDSENMTRWPGKYYTEKEFKELIDYCKKRHILFLPEIDMPGHSAAFERYFGHNMQSDSGMYYIKSLLKEFKETYPSLTHLHIGGDEVKISNKNFMPEITRFVEELGFKTYGWDPGSNLQASTVRQLWMGGPKAIDKASQFEFIDSKHLYINHMDPLETVTTLFFRQFAEQKQESDQLKGAILCSWPDRAVAHPEDMFLQSAIYPGLLTFAERAWRGNGEAEWKVNLPQEGTASFVAFSDFEDRLLQHKERFFEGMPFPYVQQTKLKWELIGPFDNGGDLQKRFDIEQAPFADHLKVAKTQVGATVILRHWWADVVKGALDDPKPNSTWYARTKIWSDQEEVRSFWIGFGNLSRSYASDTPKEGTWDDLSSQVFVNGSAIPAPTLRLPGRKGSLDAPLIDEGYSFRMPTNIKLKKGWNEVLIKVPVGKFAGKDWQNPVKWMYTFTLIP